MLLTSAADASWDWFLHVTKPHEAQIIGSATIDPVFPAAIGSSCSSHTAAGTPTAKSILRLPG
jgi:hypothetical protein